MTAEVAPPTASAPLPHLPPTVRRLGWLHFANDFTLDFLTPLLPSGVPAAWIGLLQGADAIGQLLKLFTGRASDRTGRRVGWVRAGYAVNAVARPLTAIGLALAAPVAVVLCRAGDRVGKGVRGSASDALVADWVDGEAPRALAYARMRIMDHLGATAGPLVAAAAVYLLPQRLPWLVAALAIPALAMLWWCRGLADAPKPPPAASDRPPGFWPRDPGLRAPLTILAIGALGEDIGPLLVLAHVAGLDANAHPEARWPLWLMCLGWAAFGLVQMLAAALGGPLTARLGSRRFLAGAYAFGALVFAALAFSNGPLLIAAALAYGVLTGASEGAQKTFLAAIAPRAERALAFGAFALIDAIALAVANGLCGWGLTRFAGVTFLAPAAALALSAALLAAWRPRPRA